MSLHRSFRRLQSRYVRSSRRFVFGLAVIGFSFLLGGNLLFPSLVQAGTVNHGDFVGTTVTYTDVTEASSDPVPLFGTPATLDDTLSFFQPGAWPNPSLGFSASAPPSDTTDGFLSFGVIAMPGAAISAVEIFEGGDYAMSSLGSALAKVTANLVVSEFAITHVDGAPINPIVVASSIDSISYELPGDPPVGLWGLSSFFDVDQILTDAAVAYSLGATQISVKLNNTLQALADPTAAANIVKKGFDIGIETRQVPEPASCALAMLGLAMIVSGWRREI